MSVHLAYTGISEIEEAPMLDMDLPKQDLSYKFNNLSDEDSLMQTDVKTSHEEMSPNLTVTSTVLSARTHFNEIQASI